MPYRYVWKRVKDVVVHRILHVDDTPHRIAMGVAIGMFIAWTPTIGFQTLLVIAVATLLRANKLVGIPCVWLSNPFTLGPIYYPNYLVGKFLLGSSTPAPDFSHINMTGGWWQRVTAFWHGIMAVMPPLALGSVVVGLVLGVMFYFLTHWAVVTYRAKRHHGHVTDGGSVE